MSRYSDRDIEHNLHISCQKRDRIDGLKTLEYENSILYNKDVLQNDKAITDVVNTITSLSDSTNNAIKFAQDSKTDFKTTIDLLNKIPRVSSSMLKEANSVRQKIYDASKLVFEEQLDIYNANNLEIDKIIDNIGMDLHQYSEDIKTYQNYKNIYNNLADDDSNKENYKIQYNRYYDSAQKYLDYAEGRLGNLSSKIDENSEIVDIYLKSVI